MAAHLAAVLEVLSLAGVDIALNKNTIAAAVRRRLRPINLTAGPYPRIPTDVQAQLTVLAAVTGGVSMIGDGVFGERFGHIAELQRLGASISVHRGAVIVKPVETLIGAAVKASDLRASAALVLAGLTARGTTVIRGLNHLGRGYEKLDAKLRSLGADVQRMECRVSTTESSPAFRCRVRGRKIRRVA
jgi:UDP-N-acetylglucosamine 1-carboxyvinyltransferase